MNDSTADAKLDALLQNWSHEHAADALTLDRLQRVVNQSVTVPASGRKAGSKNSRAVVGVCAIAACLVVAVFVGLRSHDTTIASNTDPRVKLTALWNETDRLFGRDLKWICDLDGELLLGIGDNNQAAKDRVCLAITLRVFNPTTQSWEEAWSGRIACQGGVPLDFASADSKTVGSIWIQSRPDGGFAVSHWLNWRDHPELSGPIDATVASEKPQVVAEGMTDGRRIQVVQQVWRPHIG